MTDLANTQNKHRELGKMKRQKNVLQTKKQDKTPKEDLSKVEKKQSTNKEFKIMIMKLLKKVGSRMAKHRILTKSYNT